jgi:hypothetical protein
MLVRTSAFLNTVVKVAALNGVEDVKSPEARQ